MPKPVVSRGSLRADPTTEHGPPQRDRLLGPALAVYVSAAALLYSFQGLWKDAEFLLYILTGAAAAGVCVLCILRGKLLRSADALLLLFMPLCAMVSAFLNYGLSYSFISLRYFIIWAVLLSLYFVMRTASEPDRMIGLYAAASVLGLSLLCLYILLIATLSLFSEIPGKNLLRGCFQLGRLCGLGNANIFAFSCTALCLLSLYAFLRAPRRRRLIWALSGGIGWFTLGLTNCRTGILGVSFCVGVLVFSVCLHRVAAGRRVWLRVLFAAALGGLAAALYMLSMYLPAIIYRAVLSFYAQVAGKPHLLNNINRIYSRELIETGGTMGDRVLIWQRALEDIGKTPLRTWLGVSHLNTDAIGGVYAGHHEISTLHAHNTYLEVLRRFGIIGFVLLMISVVRWCAAGVRCLTGPDASVPARCLAAAAAGILLMGMTEQVPFPYGTVCSLSLPFFAVCGYFMNDRRRSQ